MNKLSKLSLLLNNLGLKDESIILDKFAAKAPTIDQFCFSTNSSFAWIKPGGKIHYIGGKTHEDWADKWVFEEEGKKFYNPQGYLFQKGWMAVTSSRSIAIGEWNSTSSATWNSFFELLYSCPNIDWEEHVVDVFSSSSMRSEKLTIRELERRTRNL